MDDEVLQGLLASQFKEEGTPLQEEDYVILEQMLNQQPLDQAAADGPEMLSDGVMETMFGAPLEVDVLDDAGVQEINPYMPDAVSAADLQEVDSWFRDPDFEGPEAAGSSSPLPPFDDEILSDGVMEDMFGAPLEVDVSDDVGVHEINSYMPDDVSAADLQEVDSWFRE